MAFRNTRNTLSALMPASGTFAGSLIGGPPGAAIGGGLGTMGSALLKDRSRQGGNFAQLPRFNQEQQGGFSQLLQEALGGMQNLPQANFDPIRQQAMSQFEQETIPGIKEQFSGADSQRSSAFEQALGGAGAGLSERLASMEQGFNMQQRGQEQSRLMSMLQMALQPQFGYARTYGDEQQGGEDFNNQLDTGLRQIIKGLLDERMLGNTSLFSQN